MQIRRREQTGGRASAVNTPSRGLTLFAALSVSALMGVLFGTLCCGFIDSQLSHTLQNAEDIYFNVRRSGNLARILFSSLAGTGFYLLMAFLLGFSAIGQPLELLLPFLKGVGSGVLLAQIYGAGVSEFSPMKALVVYPSAFIALVVIVLASREAMYLSSRLFGICFKDRLTDGLLKRVKLYSVRFLSLLAAASIAAALDSIPAMLLLGRID